MRTLPQTAMASDLKRNTNAVFKKAENGPVLVMSRASLRAVLVSPQEWNQMARRMEILEGLVQSVRINQRIEGDPSELVELGELCNELNLDLKQPTTSETIEI